ncbi:MAG: TolC family outer membrane protein [Gammaproteobacteria bacterium]|jgi:adhesin transport system outer membrane protein
MRTKIQLSALIALSALFAGNGGAATLEEVVRETVTTHPDVLIAASQRNSVEQQMEQTKAGFFPQVDLTVGTGWEHSNNPTTRARGPGDSLGANRDEADIFIRQLLYDGNGTESEYERQRARVNSRAYETFSTAEVVALKATEVYFDVIRQEILVDIARVNLESHQKTYDRIVKRAKSGVGRRADTQQALGRLALAKTNLMAEQNRLDDAISSFISVVGYEPVDLIDPISRDYLLPASLDEALSVALDNHPRLKAADSDIEAAREQYNAAKSLFYPRVHLEIQGTHNDNLDGTKGRNDQASVMLRGRYNLTGGKDMARRQETVYQIDEAKEIRDRTRRQVIESMQLSWNAYETALSQLEFFKIHVEASEAALEAYRKQFNLGQRTLIDLLDQENELFQARINLINGLNDVSFSTYRILAGTGKLLWAMEVPLPEQANNIQ